MLKKCLSFVFAFLVSHLMFSTALPTNAQTNTSAQLAEKIKADVKAIGPGQRVSVKLHARDDLVGYVSEINENDFVLTKAKEATKHTINYTDVAQIKQKNEKRISTAGKVLIGMGVLMVISIIAQKGFGG